MNSILNLYKPSGITSHQAVGRVKRILGVRKAGHTGTLDPLATGILLVCLGEATKIARFLLDADKGYRARVKLGERTDTQDAEGSIIEQRAVGCLTLEDIRQAAGRFAGHISQVPPMYSAVKVNGQALHRLARRGIEVQRQPRMVDIYEISVHDVDLPYFSLDVSCSKGTYIRTLCDDLGQALGTGAHLAALERTRVGPFIVENAVTLDELSEKGTAGTDRGFHTIDEALAGMPEVVLDDETTGKARHGVAFRLDFDGKLCETSFVRLKDRQGRIFGIGRPDGGIIKIERLLNLWSDSP